MRYTVKPPTIDDPLESWCSICANRKRPPGEAFCQECRPVYRQFQERLARKPTRRIARALFGAAAERPAPLVGPAAPTRPK